MFLGRGDHPRSGSYKPRMMPEDVTLNLDEDAPIPPCPIEGHKWGGIVHNHEVAWLAYWKNSISGEPKYVLFAATSSLKGQSDRKKFEKARKLKDYIDKIRKDYMAQLTHKVRHLFFLMPRRFIFFHCANCGEFCRTLSSLSAPLPCG